MTLQADGVSGMAFAPLRHDELPGVGIYPAEPEIADRDERGSLSGRRTEVVTYVFEHAGEVQIPELTLTWWNTSTEELETDSLPGRKLVVSPGPVGSGGSFGTPNTQDSLNGVHRLIATAGLVIVVVLVWRFGRPLTQRLHNWRRQRHESEPRYFRRALRSVRSRSARLAVRDIMHWLDRINNSEAPAQLLAFTRAHGTAEEQAIVVDFLSRLANDEQLHDSGNVVGVLKAMRARWIETNRLPSDSSCTLPELNRSG